MADAIVGGDAAACKNPKTPESLKTTVSSAMVVRRLPCLIDLPALTPDAQLKIFAIIDKSGSATMADLVAALDKSEAPAGLIVDLAAMGILEIDASRFLDGGSLVRRAPTHIAQASPEEPPNGRRNGQLKTEPDFETLPSMRMGYVPSICFVEWNERGNLQYNPAVNGAGVYLGIFEDGIHVGMSAQLHGRLRNGKHVLRNGMPPHTLVVITDVAGRLGAQSAKVLERLMALAVIDREDRALANSEVPKGAQLSRGDFVAVERLAEAAIAEISRLGLAFAENPPPVAGPQVGAQYRLDACGVKALATQTETGFVVHEGSQVRLDVARSAGPGPVKLRHDLLTSGGIVRRKGHFILLEDLVFPTANGATAFVLGSRHHPGIWTAVPIDPAPPRA